VTFPLALPEGLSYTQGTTGLIGWQLGDNLSLMKTPLAPSRLAVSDPEQLASQVINDPRRLQDLIDGLASEKASARYGCAKALRLVSEQRPELLYPHFNFFAGLLDHPNQVFQWDAARLLACLAAVDNEDRFAAMFERYFAPIRGPVMITAANVIQGGAVIARAKPPLADRIAAQILGVSRARYATPECRNVAIGHALVALGEIFGLLSDPAPAVRFARRQLKNSRPATRRKAESFLRCVQH